MTYFDPKSHILVQNDIFWFKMTYFASKWCPKKEFWGMADIDRICHSDYTISFFLLSCSFHLVCKVKIFHYLPVNGHLAYNSILQAYRYSEKYAYIFIIISFPACKWAFFILSRKCHIAGIKWIISQNFHYMPAILNYMLNAHLQADNEYFGLYV